jgi:DNA-binding transcriptional LysR family regulator
LRQEGSRRGGEKLTVDEFGWFAAKRLSWRRGETLPLATLAPPCGVRALAIRALDKAGIAWSERFVGGGVTAVVAAALAGLAVAPLARRIAPPAWSISGRPEAAAACFLEGDAALEGQRSRQARALRTLAATFRSVVGSA